jgi:hypothetical protein
VFADFGTFVLKRLVRSTERRANYGHRPVYDDIKIENMTLLSAPSSGDVPIRASLI